ncbi:MAG TPA: hypothetical protein VEL76_13720 [Gemmataceae bacterium]|nr:hypothetical protein [Gemmataceae bacterium]
MTQPAATTEKKAAAQQPLVPPEERFWQRYSPHHEAPLSGAGSLTLHALLLGALAFLAFRFTSDHDEHKPVKIELAEIDGAEGDLDGLGLGKSLFKEEKRRPREAGAEGVGSPTNAGKPNAPLPDKNVVALPDVKRPELKLPPGGEQPDTGTGQESFTELEKTIRGVEHSIAMAMNPPEKPGGGQPGGKDNVDQKGGSGGPLGKGGTGLKGNNPGGGRDPRGKLLTSQQKRQGRWRLIMSDDGPSHLAQLKALKVTLVVPTRSKDVFRLLDLSRPNPTFENTTVLAGQRDKVWWRSDEPRQLPALAAALRIETPPAVWIFLPKGLEARMAELEQAYQGRSEDEIEMTLWEVPLRDGHYAQEPSIMRQVLRGRR